MSQLFSWVSAAGDNTPWTDVTVDGSAVFSGSPVKKVFNTKAATAFDTLGHYQTIPVIAAARMEFEATVEVSATSALDCMVFSLVADSASINIAGTWAFYFSAAIYAYENGATQVPHVVMTPVADQVYVCKFVIREDGGVDFYIDGTFLWGGAKNANGNGSIIGKSIRMACNSAQVAGISGNLKWSAAQINTGFERQIIKEDNFANLDDWTLNETNGTVQIAGNILTLDLASTSGAWNVNGAMLTQGYEAVPGLQFEIKIRADAWPISFMGITDQPDGIIVGGGGNVVGIDFTGVSADFLLVREATQGQTSIFLPSGGATPSVFYTLKIKLEAIIGGKLWGRGMIDGDGIVSVNQFQTGESFVPYDFTGKTVYFNVQTRSAGTIVTDFKEFNVSIDGEEAVATVGMPTIMKWAALKGLNGSKVGY